MVVAHRGSYGSFPEHSIAAYNDAYHSGADFSDIDLEISKDGYLVAIHDPYLNDTTNVTEYAETFAHLLSDDGKYYVCDFTLAELKMLRLRQRYASRSQLLNDKYELLTLEEVIGNFKMFN